MVRRQTDRSGTGYRGPVDDSSVERMRYDVPRVALTSSNADASASVRTSHHFIRST